VNWEKEGQRPESERVVSTSEMKKEQEKKKRARASGKMRPKTANSREIEQRQTK